MIFNFQQFSGLRTKAHASTLGQIPEKLYKMPDMGKEAVPAAV